MDDQDYKKPITSAVHEVHGVHFCHRCGWPFPNPHPSAKHRRAHKRVCGKIEGYKVSRSDLAISDDSDEGDKHTPSPKMEKSNVKESNSDGGVRLRSNKSEDDVFSDAATEFSESGMSPSLEERVEIIKGDEKKIEQKSVDGDINANLLKKVDESAEITEKLNDPISSDQMCTGVEAVSVEPRNHLQSDIKYDSPKSVHVQVEGDKLASASLTSKEEKASNPALMAVEKKEEPHDKLDGSTHVSDTTKSTAVEDKPEMEDAKVPEEPHDKLDGSTRVSDTTKSTAVEDKPEMEDAKVPLGGESDTFVPRETNVDDVGSAKEKCSGSTVSIPVFHNSSGPEDDSTKRVLEENANHLDEQANCEIPVAGNESGKGAAVEEQVIFDSSKPSVNSTNPLCSGEVDVDPRQLEILSETDSGLLEFKDVEFMKSCQGFEASNVTGLDIGLNLDVPDVVGVKSVGVADVVDESNRDGDVVFSEKNQEHPISKYSTNSFPESLVSAENYATNNSLTNDVQKFHEDTEQKHDNSAVVLPENSDSSPPKVQETSSVKEKCLLESDSDKCHVTEDFSMPVSVGIVETPDKISQEDSSNVDKKVSDGENATVVDSISLQDEGYTNNKLINEKDRVSAADSLEGKWGSISAVETNSQSSPRSETDIQNSESRNIKVHQSRSDDFEPPSFMTLVHPGKVPDSVAAPTASEMEPAQHNKQQKSESLQAGREKNEEIIAKVTNWNAGKEHYGQLKNLLNESKSPHTKQQKDETSQKDDIAAGTTVSSIVEPEEPKLEIPHEEDWNSPAKYPTVIKKEKKKGKPYWVPFVCCSSVNRDL